VRDWFQRVQVAAVDGFTRAHTTTSICQPLIVCAYCTV
jgi:hypothetical protein